MPALLQLKRIVLSSVFLGLGLKVLHDFRNALYAVLEFLGSICNTPTIANAYGNSLKAFAQLGFVCAGA